jgi:hypothetical protein
MKDADRSLVARIREASWCECTYFARKCFHTGEMPPCSFSRCSALSRKRTVGRPALASRPNRVLHTCLPACGRQSSQGRPNDFHDIALELLLGDILVDSLM